MKHDETLEQSPLNAISMLNVPTSALNTAILALVTILALGAPGAVISVNGSWHEVSGPSGIFLPGTELLQSPFGMEFSIGSCLRRYRRSLRHHCRFLRSYCQFLQSYRDPWGDRRAPIVARLAKHKTLLNIVKHHETHVKHCKTSWTTSKTSWNT